MSIPEDIQKILDENESILLAIKQKSPFSHHTIFLTNQRLILVKPSFVGIKREIVDFMYEDIANIVINKGIFMASLLVKMKSGIPELRINGISKEDAEKLHKEIRKKVNNVFVKNELEITKALDTKATIKCIFCGNEVSSDNDSCPYCGYPLKLKCKKCGNYLSINVEICPYCGTELFI
ncbi:MAG: PH domain-containing protein [Candidatus Bathyarchaeia archaeon]